MSNDRNDITRQEFMLYFDGQLDPARREAVELALADDAERAEEVASWQRQASVIKALYGNVITEPVPERLDVSRIARKVEEDRRRRWQMAAAAVFFVVGGLAAGWFGHGMIGTNGSVGSGARGLIAEAVNAHSLFIKQRRHPVEVVAAESAHLTSWLSASLDRRLVVPDLSKEGFTLIGGRLLPADVGPAAQIMYQDADDRRLTLYLTARTADLPRENEFETQDGIGAFYWANEALTCTIVGSLSQAEMEKLAGDVFAALSGPGKAYVPI